MFGSDIVRKSKPNVHDLTCTVLCPYEIHRCCTQPITQPEWVGNDRALNSKLLEALALNGCYFVLVTSRGTVYGSSHWLKVFKHLCMYMGIDNRNSTLLRIPCASPSYRLLTRASNLCWSCAMLLGVQQEGKPFYSRTLHCVTLAMLATDP